jgi:uncharacterized membrane protein
METQLNSQERDLGDRPGTKLGKGLGWFSIALGVTELVAPRGVARIIGVEPTGKVPVVTRLFGLREIAAGALLLMKPTSPYGSWNRVFGDLLDLMTMGVAMKRGSTSVARNAFAIGNVAAVTALDVYHGVRESRRKLGEPVRRAITINRRPDEVYAMWKNFDRLSDFLSWVVSAKKLDDKVSHWVVKTPAGNVEWDAEITEDVPGRRLAWQTLPNATIPNRGCVEFLDAPGGRGTEMIVEMQVAAPLGKTIAGAEARGDLRRLKQLLEVGEIVLSDASIHTLPHAAQPTSEGDR